MINLIPGHCFWKVKKEYALVYKISDEGFGKLKSGGFRSSRSAMMI